MEATIESFFLFKFELLASLLRESFSDIQLPSKVTEELHFAGISACHRPRNFCQLRLMESHP